MHEMIQSVPSNFECRKCGNCCTINGSVCLDDKDIETMAAYLNMSVFEFTSTFTELADNRRGLRLKDHRDGSCIFLANDRSCRVHSVKPRQCRGFPHDWNYVEWTKVCSFNYPRLEINKEHNETRCN